MGVINGGLTLYGQRKNFPLVYIWGFVKEKKMKRAEGRREIEICSRADGVKGNEGDWDVKREKHEGGKGRKWKKNYVE